jgi:hypothetical protein
MTPLLSFALFTALAAAWRPTPPCTAPAGISAPAVAESMCSHEVARRGDVAVRNMGLPASETLAAGSFFAPQWPEVMGFGVSSVLDFFLGDNVRHATILGARTTPITFRQRRFPNGTVFEWTSAMMVSTAVFPAASAIPGAVDPIKLEPVGSRLVAARYLRTSDFPSEDDFDAACAGITADTLPMGYAVNSSSAWSPTFALYSAEGGNGAGFYESECWLEVATS